MTREPISKRERAALRAAVGAIYFADSSDYQTALWDVIRAISPRYSEMLANNERKAFLMLHPECREPAE